MVAYLDGDYLDGYEEVRPFPAGVMELPAGQATLRYSGAGLPPEETGL